MEETSVPVPADDDDNNARVDRSFLSRSTNPMFSENPNPPPSKNDPVDMVVNYILQLLQIHGLRNWKGHCVSHLTAKALSPDKKESSEDEEIWVPVMTLEQYVARYCSQSVNPFHFMNITSSRDALFRAVSRLRNTKDPRFPRPPVSRNVIAFATGLYSLSGNLLFSYKDDGRVKQSVDNAVAGVHIPLPLPLRIMRGSAGWDQDEIDLIDENLERQGLDENGRLLFWAMVGKALTPAEKRVDGWSAENILLHGGAMSGKSTLVRVISNIYPRENVWRTSLLNKDSGSVPFAREEYPQRYLVEIREMDPNMWESFVTAMRTSFLRERLSPPSVLAVSDAPMDRTVVTNGLARSRTLCFTFATRIKTPRESAQKEMKNTVPRIVVKAALAYRHLAQIQHTLKEPLPSGVRLL
jgi:hypothetical protein